VTDTSPSLRQALDAALDAATGKDEGAAGTIEASSGGIQVKADIADVDRLGVVIDRVEVTTDSGNIEQRAARLVKQVRPDGQRLRAIEVDNRLGGGMLRTSPLKTNGGRFYEIDLNETGGVLTRHRKDAEGQRHAEQFTMTREGLGRLVEDIGKALED